MVKLKLTNLIISVFAGPYARVGAGDHENGYRFALFSIR